MSPSHEAQPPGLEPQPSPTEVPISNQPISTIPSIKPSGSGPHLPCKSLNRKKIIASPSPSATTKKVKSEWTASTSQYLQTTEEIVERDKGVEMSSQRVKEERLDEILVPTMVEGVLVSRISNTPNVEGVDLNISSKSSNIPSSPTTTFLGNECDTDESDGLKKGSTSL